MVDTCLNVWLLEVNSSPSMEYSSDITESMVKQVLPTLADIAQEQSARLVSQEDFKVGQNIGKFTLIYNE